MNEDGTVLNQDMDDEDEDDEECPVIDILELVPSSSATNGNTADTNQVRVVVNGDGEPFFATAKTDDELAEIERCLAVEDTKKKIKKSKQKKAIDDEEERRSSGDTSVSVF
jgi:oligoribonuclease NrnB/cAMP/cGMP phosphodiesterase (DHH superfamily)